MDQYTQTRNCYLELKIGLHSFAQQLEELSESGINSKEMLAQIKKAFRASTTSLAKLDRLMFDEAINFEEICNQLPDALYIADRDGKTIYVNDRYTEMSDIPKNEVIGENVHQLNKDKKLYTNGIIPSILKTQKRQEQIGIMNRTGIPVYITGFPIFDENHDLKYAVAHDKDIQQLETVKDQLIRLKESMDQTANEAIYLRKQQIKTDELIYKSPSMYYSHSTAMTVAPTDATVLITGESGTGKELIANEIYKASKRSEAPLMKVNCAAIPESLMESELFGYAPGAFTGASKSGKTGLFELANHGTLMLDEIGEMSMSVQSKLLRVLQNHEVRKIGGTKPIPVDIRIIAATNKDLQLSIKEKTFREDLYYRLNVVPIKIAPLRERIEDVEVLALHFLEKYNKKYNKHIEIYSDALHLMEAYRWPGNVRELQNVIERLVVVSTGNAIDSHMVSMVLGINEKAAREKTALESCNLKAATASVEKHLIEKALAEYPSGRKAAAALGIDHSTLIKKCRSYGITT